MRARVLRGTRLDPFGSAAIRQIERALIGEYRSLIEQALAELSPSRPTSAPSSWPRCPT